MRAAIAPLDLSWVSVSARLGLGVVTPSAPEFVRPVSSPAVILGK